MRGKITQGNNEEFRENVLTFDVDKKKI